MLLSAPSTDAQLQFSCCPGLGLPFYRHFCSQQLVQHQLMPTGHSVWMQTLCLLWCLYLALKASDDLKSSSFACLLLPSAQPAFHSKYKGYCFRRTMLHSVHISGLFRIDIFFYCFFFHPGKKVYLLRYVLQTRMEAGVLHVVCWVGHWKDPS